MAAFDSYHNLKRGNATLNCRKSNWSELLKSAYSDEPRQILECIIDPKRICYDKFKKTVHCMRRLKLCIIQQRTSPPTQENVGFITKVMKEYAKMQTFEPFQIFVHNKCLQMIATTLTIETAYDTENALIRTKYAETTMKYLKEQATFEKFKDISSPPTIYVTLCAIEIFTLYCKQVAKKFAKNGLVTFLTKLYKESCNFNKVPEFLFRSVNILQNLARFEEARTYFTECKTIEALSVRFETSNCKELIIFLISMIDGEASQLPSLRDKDIQSYIDVPSKNDAACLSLNWLKGLKMVTQKYDSSRSKLSKHFTFFTKILADEIPEFQDTVMQILRVISSSSEACAAISKDQDLCKSISKCREKDSNLGRDAEIVYWNMSRESGNLPVFPTKNHLLDYVGTAELYSDEFPKNVEFKEQLGKGSFGTVYVVKDLDQPEEIRFVAKEISINTKHTVEHLLAEANILLKAKHQNIVRFHGYCIKNMSIYLLMEYMQMGTLSSYVIDKNGLCENKTRLFTKQILEGLNYLHQTKILHQDIKGNNILLENENIVKIADFGLSKIIEKIQDISGQAVGTVRYMAPEVVKEEVDFENFSKVDIWSVGCTVIEMITKKPPNASLPSVNVLFQIATTMTLTYTLPPDSSTELQAFLNKTFTAVPKDRPSAEQLLKTDHFLLGSECASYNLLNLGE